MGPKYKQEDILNALESFIENPVMTEKIYEKTAQLIMDNKIIGWFQGRSEFGPRALGNRSILARPFPSTNKDYINKKVKFREEFRPFAPVVIEEFPKTILILKVHLLI